MRERTLPRRLALHFLGAAAAASVVATIGPFGTFAQLAPADRYLYWAIIIPLNWAQILLAAAAVSRLGATARWPAIAVVAAGCLIASVPAAFEVLWLEKWFGLREVRALTVVELWPYVILLSLVIALPIHKFAPRSTWLARRGAEAEPGAGGPAHGAGDRPAGPDTGEAAPNFVDRVPRRLRGALLCIAAEDHYLRVHTAAGSALILYRMADALSELAGVDGLQVHRSFWVAARAVGGVERDGRRVSLRLTNGLVVPVSRTFLARVRAAGWLAGAR